MIVQEDIHFHTPENAPHGWGETYWMGLYVPEANLYAWVYSVFRAGVGAVMCDVEIIDQKSANMFDARYVDIQNHLRLPPRLDAFELANGLSFRAKSPTEYRLDYVGIHDTEIHVDIRGIHEPYDIHDPNIDPMAKVDPHAAVQHSGFGSAYASHFDLTCRVRGTLTVRGKRYPVDCLCTQDHSWGPRAERGMSMMSYINAHFAEDYVVQTIWAFDPSKPDGEQHTFKHGYAVKDGRLSGGVGGSLRIDHRGLFPKHAALTLLTQDGAEHTITGEPLAYNHWVPYGCCPTGHSMMEWRTKSGAKGIGTIMEAFPLDTVAGGFLHDDIKRS